MNALAIHGDFQLVWIFQSAHGPEICTEQLGLKNIFAIQRQSGVDQEAADGPDRKSIDVNVLRRVLAHSENLALRAGIGIAHSQGADLAGGVKITLQKNR